MRNGIDKLRNDEAARELLKAGDGTSAGDSILPALDPATGEVRGSGSGTGGGNAGEDHDHDHTAGSNTER